jgi:hypothetical protein
MRYLRQPDRYSCGPTAIINAMKWAGLDATSRDYLPYLQFSCRTIDLQNPTDADLNGTMDHDFDRVLRYVGKDVFKIKRRRSPSLPEIIRHLKRGGAVALSYFWQESGQEGLHFCFISGMDRGSFVCVNDHDAPNTATIRKRSRKTLKKWLRKAHDCPTVWFLSLEN